MARVKGGKTTRARRKKIIKLAKGYFGSKHILYRTANEQVMHSLKYAYRDRRNVKREMRKLWIARINAGARLNDLSYSKLTCGLKWANITINRKMLSEMAIHDAAGFTAICEAAKAALANGPVTAETTCECGGACEAATATTNLDGLKVAELRELAKAKDIAGYSTMKKAELIEALSA